MKWNGVMGYFFFIEVREYEFVKSCTVEAVFYMKA